VAERILYLDLVGGAAGDMLLGALLDAGAPLEAVRAAVRALGLTGVEVVTREASPAGLRALGVDVMVGGVLADSAPVPGGHDHLVVDAHHHHHHEHAHHDHEHPHEHRHAHGHRPYTEIRRLLAQADLPPRVVARAQDTFRRLAEAEGQAHGVALDDVVFHEVGADDAITDIVGVCVALEALAVDRVVVSPVPLGRGLTHGAHGPIPLPGPATLHLLKGVPTELTALRGETVTPTGAALLTALADAFGPAPAMVIEAVGVGAGHKSWPDRPNVVRALVGSGVSGPRLEEVAEDSVIEANLDDMPPEQLVDLEAALFQAGAIDVWRTPILMKKGRMGVLVSALTRRVLERVVAEAFLTHSTTLGVRVTPVTRIRAERRVDTVQTAYGPVRVKRAPRGAGPALVAPEHDDCAARAGEAKVPVRAVYEAALKAAWAEDVEGGE
jgi:uncharacterized protein (TIGR00299 family) protein